MKKKILNKQKTVQIYGNKWIFVVMFLIFLTITSYMFAWIISSDISNGISEGNVAVIPINGIIMTEGGESILGEEVTSSREIVNLLEEVDQREDIKAVVFEINSPGGSPVASKEIGDAILRMNKTTYALIRDVGASGGYWVASSCDTIVASEMSVTGSIGVISSYLDFSGLLNNYNITYNRLVAGKYKDVGTPYKKLEYDERALIQEQLDYIHEYFIKTVSNNRNLPESEIKRFANGMYFLGIKAKEMGLVDELGDINVVKNLIKIDLGIEPTFARYTKSKSIWDLFSGVLGEQSFLVGKGIGSQLVQEASYSKQSTVWI